MSLEEKYPELKKRFPNEFIFLFDRKEEFNSQGKMAKEILELEKQIAMLKGLVVSLHRTNKKLQENSSDDIQKLQIRIKVFEAMRIPSNFKKPTRIGAR